MKYRPTAIPHGAASSRSRRRLAVSYQAIGILVALAEGTMIVVGSAFGPLVYGWIADVIPSTSASPFGPGLLSSILYVAIARSTGLYRLPVLIEPSRHIARITKACVLVLLAMTAILFLLKIGSDFSRGAFVGFAAVILLLCVATRMGAADLIGALLAREGVLGRSALLVGEPDELASLSAPFLLRQFGLRDAGRLVLNGDISTYPSKIEEALTLARTSSAKEFIVAAKLDHLDVLAVIENAFRGSPLPVRLMPNHIVRSVLTRHASSQDTRLHLIEMQRAPLSMAERIEKRVVDLAGAILAIAVLAPILLVTAVAIKLDSSGPIIFRQRRKGFDQREFVILKFRTMTVLEDGARITQAKPGDERVTRVGKVLRRTSIDELPQLLNVVLGQMSLVGPRPHALAHDDQYRTMIGDYSRRHHVKPGITGWAQVNGSRGETMKSEHMRRRVDLDLWYVGNWSLSLDLKIIVRTCFEIMKQDAY